MASLKADFFCKCGLCGLMVNELLRVSCVIVAFSATLRFSAFVVSFVPGLVSDLGGDAIGLIKGEMHL